MPSRSGRGGVKPHHIKPEGDLLHDCCRDSPHLSGKAHNSIDDFSLKLITLYINPGQKINHVASLKANSLWSYSTGVDGVFLKPFPCTLRVSRGPWSIRMLGSFPISLKFFIQNPSTQPSQDCLSLKSQTESSGRSRIIHRKLSRDP